MKSAPACSSTGAQSCWGSTPFFHQGNLADKNEYIWTKADGDTGTVEVSETTLASAQAIVQSVLEAFTWIGAPRWVP